jgi:hypothetical protein
MFRFVRRCDASTCPLRQSRDMLGSLALRLVRATSIRLRWNAARRLALSLRWGIVSLRWMSEMRSECSGHRGCPRGATPLSQGESGKPRESLHNVEFEKVFMGTYAVRFRQSRVSMSIKGRRIKTIRFYNESRRQRPAPDNTRKQENVMQYCTRTRVASGFVAEYPCVCRGFRLGLQDTSAVQRSRWRCSRLYR